MRVFKNGDWIETDDVLVISNDEINKEELSYEQKIVKEIRSVYSIDDELAILRQRDTKPEEFQVYFDFVEDIKNKYKNTI